MATADSILIVGHSHLGVFGVHRARVHEEPAAPEYLARLITEVPRRIEGLSLLCPEKQGSMIDGLHAFARGKTLVMLWRGGFHQSRFLILEQPPFDFILSDESRLSFKEAARLVPETAVEAALSPSAQDLRGWISSIQNLDALMPGRIIVAATPPPKGDLPFIYEHIAREFGEESAAKLRDSSSSFAVCEPATMSKIWKLSMRMHRAVAQELGVEFLPVPAECLDETGCLRREYYGNDVTHANSAWGDLFLKNLNAYLDRTGRTDGQSL